MAAQEKSMNYVLAEAKPTWLKWIAPEQFFDVDLFRIIVFYVFHSPCDGISSMGKPLEEYGWKNPWKKSTTLSQMLKDASSNPKLLYPAETYNEMKQVLQDANLFEGFPSDLQTERIAMHKDSKMSQFMSVFRHIRNALAHARMDMIDIDHDRVFILEDKNNKNRVSARMILRQSTLLKWIDIIERREE